MSFILGWTCTRIEICVAGLELAGGGRGACKAAEMSPPFLPNHHCTLILLLTTKEEVI